MSRAQKILKLLKDNKENRFENNKQLFLEESGTSNILKENTLEAGPSDEKPDSPLPPGADIIISELSEIARDVFSSPFIIEDANTSFEASPPVIIAEFEDDVVGTPKSPLKIPTPMPSPTNSHKSCEDVFCGAHDRWVEALPSSPDTVSAVSSVSESDSSSVSSSSQKKRKKCKDSWSDVKRKYLTNLGKKYVSKRGKVVDEKVMGEPCKCRFKCYDKITHTQRLNCFTKFWSLGSREKQWAFVVKFTLKVKKYRCLNTDQPNLRKFTYKYNLPITSTSATEVITVCKTMFLNTLSVSERLVQTAFQKFDGVSNIDIDRRGRHTTHRVVLDGEMERSVSDHVKSFAPVESHYVRRRSNKLYLDGNLSFGRMFILYKEWFDPLKYKNKASTERQYREIVSKHFNIGFHIPKKDACDICHIHRNKTDCTENEITLYEKHIRNKNLARKLKNEDKNAAIQSNNKIITAVFDFQKVLSCPQGQISVFYYKRKLSCFNFTVFDMGNKQAVCYMWDETISKRGANEVSSSLLHFVKEKANDGANEIRFWSDNCAGQNRNRIVFYFYMYAAKLYNISITHRFLEKGHTQNEGDSLHALIERVSKARVIYTPDEWRTLVRWAKTDGNPYRVQNMQQTDFFDFKSKVNNKLWAKNNKKQKIMWNQIKQIHVNKNEPNKLYYKYDLHESDTYDCLVLGSNTRNSSTLLPILKPISNILYKISKDKYNDLISMCNTGVITSDHSNYFRSLPCDNSNSSKSNDSDTDG